jgi:hypothetical protein
MRAGAWRDCRLADRLCAAAFILAECVDGNRNQGRFRPWRGRGPGFCLAGRGWAGELVEGLAPCIGGSSPLLIRTLPPTSISSISATKRFGLLGWFLVRIDMMSGLFAPNASATCSRA